MSFSAKPFALTKLANRHANAIECKNEEVKRRRQVALISVLSISETSSNTVVDFWADISLRADQNSSLRLTLVLCPLQLMERLRTGDLDGAARMFVNAPCFETPSWAL